MPLPPEPQTKPQWPKKVGYITQTTRPLNCLVFLLPILVLHFVGLLVFVLNSPTAQPKVNAAFGILRGLLSLFGSTALYVPGLLIVAILLTWHLAKGYPWQVRARTILGMAAESFIFAWPLLVLCTIIVSEPPVLGAAQPTQSAYLIDSITSEAVLRIGAGIYEELLFRLALVSAVAAMLNKIGNLAEDYSLIFAGIASALLFGAYHFFYFEPGEITFIWPRFIFYFLAGIYFTGLYVLRGFGITVGVHIAYDLIVLALFHQ